MLPENRVPTHPGKILLKDFLIPAKISQHTFAGYAGLRDDRVVEFCQERIDFTFAELIRVALATGTSREMWFNLQGDYRFVVDNLVPHLPPMPEFLEKDLI